MPFLSSQNAPFGALTPGTCATGEVPHPFNRLDNLGPRLNEISGGKKYEKNT